MGIQKGCVVDVGVRDTELNVWTRNPHLDSRLELTSKKKKKDPMEK